MTPLYLAVLPRRSGRNQLMLHTGVLQSDVKRTEFRIADVLVCKLRPVIRLDRLNLEWKYFLKHFEELYRVFRCMLLKPDESAVASAVTAFLCRHICTFPAVAKVRLPHSFTNHIFFTGCMLMRMAIRSVRLFFQRLPEFRRLFLQHCTPFD